MKKLTLKESAIKPEEKKTEAEVIYNNAKDELKKVLNELSRIESGSSVDPDLIVLIRQIATIMEGMQHEDDWR